MDMIFLVFGLLFAGWSGFYLLYEASRKKSGLGRNGRILYIVLGTVNLYAGVIYFLVLIGNLPMNGYGMFVRPVLAPILAGDGFVAAYHRQGGKNV